MEAHWTRGKGARCGPYAGSVGQPTQHRRRITVIRRAARACMHAPENGLRKVLEELELRSVWQAFPSP
jgi:hypothetical protein